MGREGDHEGEDALSGIAGSDGYGWGCDVGGRSPGPFIKLPVMGGLEARPVIVSIPPIDCHQVFPALFAFSHCDPEQYASGSFHTLPLRPRHSAV
jgi:hypothetical protein